MIILIMKQISKNRWRIETKDEKIVVDEIILANHFEAEEYVKAYVSTWGWEYEVKEL